MMGPDPMMGMMGSNDDGTRSYDDGMGPMMGPDPMMMGMMDPMMGCQVWVQ